MLLNIVIEIYELIEEYIYHHLYMLVIYAFIHKVLILFYIQILFAILYTMYILVIVRINTKHTAIYE